MRDIEEKYESLLNMYSKLVIEREAQQQEIEHLKGGQWISVDDRLPEAFEVVLCTYGDRPPYIAMNVNGAFMLDMRSCFPTHWQPLPKPPEENRG